MERILRNTEAQLQVTFYSADDPQDADGAVLVDITRADGTMLVTGATASKPAATTGVYRYTLAPQANLDILTAKWTGAFAGVSQSVTTLVEVVGGYYVALAEVRTLPGMSDQTKYPDDVVEEKRRWFEDVTEQECRVAFVPRYGREVLSGSGTAQLHLRQHHRIRKILSVSIGGVAQTVGDFTTDSMRTVWWTKGVFTPGTPTNPFNVAISYEHGYNAPDEELHQAALQAIHTKLLAGQDAVPDRASQISTGEMTLDLSTAGVTQPTGIREVDGVIQRKREILSLVS